MRQVTTNVYKYDELSHQAQSKAYQQWHERQNDYFWANENRATLKAFENEFPVNISKWSYGGRGEGVSFSMTCDDAIEELTGTRLATYIWNNYWHVIYSSKQYWICEGRHNTVGINAKSRHSKIFLVTNGCNLTGYCMDNEILSPLVNFMDKPDNSNFKDLMETCFDAWITACNKDYEHSVSEEYFIENEANNYEFTSEGEMI